MAITLQSLLATGEINYISKHNANYQTIQNALNTLFDQMAATFGGAATAGVAFEALLGQQTAVIGVDSYACSGAGSTLTVQPGWCWIYSAREIRTLTSAAQLSFAGLSAATYYITADATGAPVRQLISTDALYSVVWDGSAFGTITRLAPVAWGYDDVNRAKTSSALGQSFDRLDDRLEAGEAKAVNGDLANVYIRGRLAKSVAGGENVALTATEANNRILELTGALTANIAVIVPTSGAPREWTVYNNTTGAYTLTVKTASGTGVVIAQGARALLYCDGTNVVRISTDQIGEGVAETRSTPASSSGALTIDIKAGAAAETTLTENITTLTLANPPASGKAGRLRWIIRQDATGGRTVAWPASVKWGTAGAPTLSTAANAVDIIDFETTDGGATWWARVYGLGY